MAPSKRRGLTADESRVADHFSNMDDHQLQCWVTGRHVRPLITDPRKTKFTRRRDGVYQQVWRCLSCKTQVTELTAPSGYLDDRVGTPHYDYEDGYRRPKSARGVKLGTARAIARREARQRNEEAQRQLERARKVSRAGHRQPGSAKQHGDSGSLGHNLSQSSKVVPVEFKTATGQGSAS